MGKHQVPDLVVIEERVGNDMSDVDRFSSEGLVARETQAFLIATRNRVSAGDVNVLVATRAIEPVLVGTQAVYWEVQAPPADQRDSMVLLAAVLVRLPVWLKAAHPPRPGRWKWLHQSTGGWDRSRPYGSREPCQGPYVASSLKASVLLVTELKRLMVRSRTAFKATKLRTRRQQHAPHRQRWVREWWLPSGQCLRAGNHAPG